MIKYCRIVITDKNGHWIDVNNVIYHEILDQWFCYTCNDNKRTYINRDEIHKIDIY